VAASCACISCAFTAAVHCTRRSVGRVRALLLPLLLQPFPLTTTPPPPRCGRRTATRMDIRGGRDRRPGDRRPHRGPRAPRRPQWSPDQQQRVVVGAETAAGSTATTSTAGPYKPPPLSPPRLLPSPRMPLTQPPPPRLLRPQTPPTPKTPATEQPQPSTPRLPPAIGPQPQQECRIRESGDGVEDCGAAAGGSGVADDTELLAKLRCPSESAEVVAEREKRRQRRRCPDYPGLALSSSVFSTETGMKFSIIRNELHNVLKPQLRRVSRWRCDRSGGGGGRLFVAADCPSTADRRRRRQTISPHRRRGTTAGSQRFSRLFCPSDSCLRDQPRQNSLPLSRPSYS